MPSRTFNAPPYVVQFAGDAAFKGGTTIRAVLLAAVRAACEHPPAAPVSYPTLTTAERKVVLPLSADLHAALRIVEGRYFYGRTAWLCFYALIHHAARVEELLRLDAGALDTFDRAVYKSLTSEVNPCPVPLSTRTPKAPRR